MEKMITAMNVALERCIEPLIRQSIETVPLALQCTAESMKQQAGKMQAEQERYEALMARYEEMVKEEQENG